MGLFPSARSPPVGTAEEGRKSGEHEKQNGADFIKVYCLLPPRRYFAIAEESKKAGIVFAGHVPTARQRAGGFRCGPKMYRAPHGNYSLQFNE